MLLTRRIIAGTVFVLGVEMVSFHGAVAVAQNGTAARPPDPSLEALHRRRIQEGERASRALRPSARRPAPNNGIVQIPIDTSATSGPIKGEPSLVTPTPSPGPGRPPPPKCPYWPINPYTSSSLASSQFPTKTASLIVTFANVAWHVCVTDMRAKSLWVGPVHLRRGGQWMTVLHQAGLAEIFVPYHQTNFRPYDLQWVTQLDQVTAQDAGNNGSLITLTNETAPTVVAEVRDRGVGWLCKQSGMATRRGQEFVVWGVADGGNYDNIVQYAFRDDGGMSFRMGNTGFNSPEDSPGYPPPTEAHTHNALWRVDMDLNGAPNNSASWLHHAEPDPTQLQARDYQDMFGTVPFNTESSRQWNALQFSSLLIEDAATNVFSHRLGYEFTPVQTGISRHNGWKEAWTNNDVYVTVYHSNELSWIKNWAYPDDYLLTSLTGESVSNADVVVWIKSSAHHHPLDEDRSSNDLSNLGTTGVTLAHWSGFDVEPHDLFSTNPMGAPVRCWQPANP